MTNTDPFSLQKSDLNGFLFADIGVEQNGNTLSVLSALARTGADPWKEGGRLAKLSRGTAIKDLSATIATISTRLSPGEDPNAIAMRLVRQLPIRGHDPSIMPTLRPMPASGRTNVSLFVIMAIIMALIAGLSSNSGGPTGGGATNGAPPATAASVNVSASHATPASRSPAGGQ